TLFAYQRPITALLIRWNLTERHPFIGGIEYEQMAQPGMLIHGRHRLGITGLRKRNRQNHVIEKTRRSRRIFSYNTARSIDHDVIGFNAYLSQHGAQQSGFVFAVAVPVVEDICSTVWPPSADSYFNGRVADIMLGKTSQGLDAL